jgi:cell division protein FtsQ
MDFKTHAKNLKLPLEPLSSARANIQNLPGNFLKSLPKLAVQAEDTATSAAANVRAVMWRIWRARLGRAALVMLAVINVAVFYHYRTPIGTFAEQKLAEALGAKVAKVVVEGATYTDGAVLLQTLGLQKGSSLVSFNAADARARLEALPWVRLAAVERRLPDTVRVEVYEHVPLARVDVNGEMWVINKDGEAIEPETPRFASLPVLEGQGAATAAAKLFAVLAEWPNLTGQLARASYVGGRRWDISFKSGVTVKLPEENPNLALRTLAELEKTRHVLTLNAGEVDLRIEGRVVLRLPPEVQATPVVNISASSHSTQSTEVM